MSSPSQQPASTLPLGGEGQYPPIVDQIMENEPPAADQIMENEPPAVDQTLENEPPVDDNMAGPPMVDQRITPSPRRRDMNPAAGQPYPVLAGPRMAGSRNVGPVRTHDMPPTPTEHAVRVS